jgi:hypothetical protein
MMSIARMLELLCLCLVCVFVVLPLIMICYCVECCFVWNVFSCSECSE